MSVALTVHHSRMNLASRIDSASPIQCHASQQMYPNPSYRKGGGARSYFDRGVYRGGANSGFCVEPRGLPPREQNGMNGK
jgi:hypothetical protein